MARENDTTEPIFGMLREAEVRLSQGEKTGAICDNGPSFPPQLNDGARPVLAREPAVPGRHDRSIASLNAVHVRSTGATP